MPDFKFKLKQEINMTSFGVIVKGIVFGRTFKEFSDGTETTYHLYHDNDRYEQTEDDLVNIN